MAKGSCPKKVEAHVLDDDRKGGCIELGKMDDLAERNALIDINAHLLCKPTPEDATNEPHEDDDGAPSSFQRLHFHLYFHPFFFCFRSAPALSQAPPGSGGGVLHRCHGG
jgi:hypothetical protein